MSKPKVAFYWCASCGGCEEAVVDLNEDLLQVAEKVDIVFWPVALDFKRSDVEKLSDRSIAVSFINGAIRTREQEEMVRLLRKKSAYVAAFGSCAHIGGIPGLGNQFAKEKLLKLIYEDLETNDDRTVPKPLSKADGNELEIPEICEYVRTLDQTIDVDYYIPGCAPPADIILKGLTAFLKGELPPKGTVFASDKSLCDTCPLRDKKPDKFSIKELKRPHEVIHDPEKCFLSEGIICLGPATRSGCGERCINANMPCRGCFGPSPRVYDQGAKILSAIASLLGIDEEEIASEEDVSRLIDSIPDPVGLFYMYSLPASNLGDKRRNDEQKDNS